MGRSDTDKDFYFILLSVIIIIILGAYFVFSAELTCESMWVIFNLIFGYVALTNERIRKKYVLILRGALKPRLWAYAVMILALTLLSFLSYLFLAAPSPSTGSGSSSGNPFVSSAIFLAAVTPIIPLFAYAETQVFQRYILAGILRKYARTCPNCGGKSIGVERCDLCGFAYPTPIPTWARAVAVTLSALVFATAHVILVGSPLAFLTFIGGYIMADMYIKEGWLPVARIHALYDYIIIGIIIGGLLL